MKSIQVPVSIGVLDESLETEATISYNTYDGDVEVVRIEISTGSDITDIYPQDKLNSLEEQIREGEIYAI